MNEAEQESASRVACQYLTVEIISVTEMEKIKNDFRYGISLISTDSVLRAINNNFWMIYESATIVSYWVLEWAKV